MKEVLNKLKNTDNSRRPLVYTLAFMLLFWTIYDCIVTYVAPLLISENGFSNSMMGLIIGSSSVAGALFDFLLCRIFKRSDFRRIFIIMLAACFLYPLILWSAKTFWIFIVAMVAWGLYYDLYSFGVFDFISHYTKKADYSANFGVIQVFRSVGAVLAPLFVGLVIFEETVGPKPLILSWIFLSIATIFFISLIIQAKKAGPIIKTETLERKRAWIAELRIWRRLGAKFFPLLLATFYLFFVESFFWTLAPLYAEMSDLKQFGGLFLAAFNLPALLLGWFVGSFTRRLGKAKTAFWGILMGSLILASFHFFSSSLLVVAITFISSCFLGLSFPAINSIYADMIAARPKQETDIEGLEDFSFNLSYFFGPMLAGVLADVFSISWAFTLLGFFGLLIALFLWFSAYRKKR